MRFKQWLNESTSDELYQSAVNAFPGTRKRQHATDTIEISNVRLDPYRGMNTLLVRALAQNEGREYNPVIVFKNINYHDGPGENIISVTHNDIEYFLEKPTLNENDILIRCQCGDFHWRWNYFDHIDRSLQGRVRAPYEAIYNPGSANPQKMPGMCKHLMKAFRVLQESQLII